MLSEGTNLTENIPKSRNPRSGVLPSSSLCRPKRSGEREKTKMYSGLLRRRRRRCIRLWFFIQNVCDVCIGSYLGRGGDSAVHKQQRHAAF